MLIVCFIGIAAENRVSFSRQVQLIRANQTCEIHYSFSLLNGVVPVLTVLQTIPYAQSFSLDLGSYGSSGFFVKMSASSGMSRFQLASSKFTYLIIDYNYNYFNTVFQILASGVRTVTQVVEVGNNFLVLFIIGLSVPASSTSVQQSIQASFQLYRTNNWQMQLRSYFNSLYKSARITILRFNNVLEDTGIHVLKHRANTITTNQIVQNLQVGDYCKTHCRVLSGLTRFKTNQKQLYFKMSLLSVDRIQVSDIQVPQSSYLVQIYFLNYPEYLRESQTSPTLPLNNSQYFYPYNRSILPCDPCYKQIITGVYQCLRLFEYYSAQQSSCLPCLDYCSFCLGSDFCTICTPFSTSDSQFTQCKCDVQYYPHQSRKTCEPCQVLCRTCYSLSCFSCSSYSVLHSAACLCDLKYFLPTGGRSCSPCQNNCLKCDDQNSCLCPELRHYTFPYSSECSACPDGCQLCSSSQSCRACILEAQLQQGQCRCISQQQVLQGFACVPCNPECLACNPDNSCSCSKLGQFLGPLDVCYNCSANCISCASAEQCRKCEGNWILAEGRCFEQCPAHSTFSNKILYCICDPPFYSRFNQSSLQCYLDGSLNGWSAERLQALVKTQDSAKNASRQISNVLSVLLIVGVATLLGDAIESFAILKLHLFYLLPIHPFLDVVFNVFERILSGDLFGRLVRWLESHFADLQLAPANFRLAGYTNKRIFFINSATFFLQVVGIVAKQILLALLNCIVKNFSFKLKPLTRALHESRGLLSCSKTEQLTFVSIQLLSFSLGWTYLVNSLLSLLVVSLILFAQIYRKLPINRISREQAFCSVVLNTRVMLIACFIFFSSSIYLQAIPPILLNSIAMIALLVYKQNLGKYYWIRNLLQTGSVLTLEIYLLLGAFYNQSRAYSIAVYAIVAVCLAHVSCNVVMMVVRLYKLAKRLFKSLRKQKKKKKISQLSKRKLIKYFK